MKTRLKIRFYFLSLLMMASIQIVPAQSENGDLERTIRELDSNFWKAYNSCDLNGFETYLNEDLEFYHDKGGLTKGLKPFLRQVENGLCSNKNGRLRREAVKSSIQIYPLNNYGAVMTGEHVFYLSENNDGNEKLIEKAKFTHIWQLKHRTWKMSRVISYDHQAISENSAKEEIVVSREILEGFTGNYKAPNTGNVNISLTDDNVLKMDAGPMKAQLRAETENLFFISEAPITLEFVKGPDGDAIEFIVRENGKVIEKAIRQKG